jgi:hypothetical protein
MREMKVDQIHYVCTAAVGAADDRMFSLVSFCAVYYYANVPTALVLIPSAMYVLKKTSQRNEKGMTAKGV